MSKQIWLIGGTQESARLAQAIALYSLPCTITATTESARALYPPSAPQQAVSIGALTPDTIEPFLHDRSIGCILDASHPFAVEISQLAIAAAQSHSIPYLRFERPTAEALTPRSPLEQQFDSIELLLLSGCLKQERVLLTLGYRFLPLFQPWHDQATLFARILPSPVALDTALSAGFAPERLIALRPPLSRELERALWQQWQISMVVAKASGSPGGEDVKRELAHDLGIALITIARPEIGYPQSTSNIQTAIAFCQSYVAAPHPWCDR